MHTKTDFVLGITISLLGYLSCIFYFAAFPLAHIFSLICLVLLTLTSCIYTSKTSLYHLSSLMIIPCLLWIVLLKHSYLYNLHFNVTMLAYIGTLCTAFHMFYTFYVCIKHTSSTWHSACVIVIPFSTTTLYSYKNRTLFMKKCPVLIWLSNCL